MDVTDAARQLLGALLIRQIANKKLVGKIVETESYHQSDEASHSFRGQTHRNQVMFGPAGHAYVYFTYGMHFCFNVVTGSAGEGSAVLVRALEPLEGIEIMCHNRGTLDIRNLCSGPAKLCQALKITQALNGHDLSQPPLILKAGQPVSPKQVVKTKRIGISRALDKEWRFYLKDSPFVSKL